MKERITTALNRILAIMIALIIWHLLAVSIQQEILIVTPVAVVKRLFTLWQVHDFWKYVWFTFHHIAGGFMTGLVVGIILAVCAYRLPFFETLLWPYMATIKSVPVASFIVICLIWLSTDNLSSFISFLIVVPVIYGNILTGLRVRDEKLEQMAEVFRIPMYRRIAYITIPGLRPYITSACQVTVGMAWKAGVAAEIIGTPKGSIGKQLYLAKIYLDTDDLLAWTVVIVCISVLAEKIFMKLLDAGLTLIGGNGI